LLRSIARGELILDPGEAARCLRATNRAAAACEDWRKRRFRFDAEGLAIPQSYAEGVRRRGSDARERFQHQRPARRFARHQDAVNHRLRAGGVARFGSASGGAIPDNADYRVVLEPSETFIGTVNEDFAIESLPGDIFQLGNASWKILRVNSGQVRVQDAHGQPPSIPFWLGEAPGRTDELSRAVSGLREDIASYLARSAGPELRN
jgi:ATP-dependent Lhr-like helicase